MLEAASGFRITAAKAEHHRQVEHPLGASVEVPLGKSLEVLEHLRRLGAVVEAGGVVDEQFQGLIVEAGSEQAVEGVGGSPCTRVPGRGAPMGLGPGGSISGLQLALQQLGEELVVPEGASRGVDGDDEQVLGCEAPKQPTTV